MLSEYGTEQVGISAEIALADLSEVEVSNLYRLRGRQEIVEHLMPLIAPHLGTFPKPTTHIAEDQNPVDFMLEGGGTLSVKTNMRSAGKQAPQNIGQPTSSTFWSRLPELVPQGVDPFSLSYRESASLFKEVALTRTAELMTEYWKNLFECDYLLFIFDVLDKENRLSAATGVRVFGREQVPDWGANDFTFTKGLADWNESCTVKFRKYSIGEFQVHNNRNCFKFRFNMAGLLQARLL